MKKSKRRQSPNYKAFNEESISFSSSFFSNQNTKNINEKKQLKASLCQHREYLFGLLLSLDGVVQSPKYHPESDALFHTLQVFELAYKNSEDPELWLAALFHDVGKSVDSKTHAEIGAEMVTGIFSERVVWLIKHHLDLMISPRKTQQRFADTQKLKDLTKLRRWDLAGRSLTAKVSTPEEALDLILDKY